jgi:Na+/H+ antiporter NhaD/arsenite permease-like protein
MFELVIISFILGYLAITFEHTIKVNKAAIALITGVVCWSIYIMFQADKEIVIESLNHHLGDISGILFFLLGAMTIIELIDAHNGFDIITKRITQTNKSKLLWSVAIITFFLSSVLDNLTTTIIMISLLRKFIKADKDRLYFAGIVVIAANAGGAWSPIGDVTTTMLWIGGQITAGAIVYKLFLPSIISLIVPVLVLSYKLKGEVEKPTFKNNNEDILITDSQKKIIFFAGIAVLVFVPIFKTITHLPPFMGILLGLGFLWILTEMLHIQKGDEHKHHLSVVQALRKIDTPSILFFLGILLSITALESIGILNQVAKLMSENLKNDNIIVISIGLLSSIVDNVPLVAATQGMYTLTQYPTDHYFWEFLAYCAGTGGSILIIGSAAGVAAMGMERISFIWYLKHISLLALIGFFSGVAVYILGNMLF